MVFVPRILIFIRSQESPVQCSVFFQREMVCSARCAGSSCSRQGIALAWSSLGPSSILGCASQPRHWHTQQSLWKGTPESINMKDQKGPYLFDFLRSYPYLLPPFVAYSIELKIHSAHTQTHTHWTTSLEEKRPDSLCPLKRSFPQPVIKLAQFPLKLFFFRIIFCLNGVR